MARRPLIPARDRIDLGTLDMNDPETAERFRRAAEIYTKHVTRSKATAVEALKQQGFLTRSGRRARIYETKP